MKTTKKVLIIVLAAIVLPVAFFLMQLFAVTGMFSVFYLPPPGPEIRNAEFRCSVEYMINDVSYTLNIKGETIPC